MIYGIILQGFVGSGIEDSYVNSDAMGNKFEKSLILKLAEK